MKAAYRKEVFAISRSLRENYHRLSKLICDAGTDEEPIDPDCRFYGTNQDYPPEWIKAIESLDLAIQEMNQSVGRDRYA